MQNYSVIMLTLVCTHTVQRTSTTAARVIGASSSRPLRKLRYLRTDRCSRLDRTDSAVARKLFDAVINCCCSVQCTTLFGWQAHDAALCRVCRRAAERRLNGPMSTPANSRRKTATQPAYARTRTNTHTHTLAAQRHTHYTGMRTVSLSQTCTIDGAHFPTAAHPAQASWFTPPSSNL